jgi:uncharacterized protein (DUF58 family)
MSSTPVAFRKPIRDREPPLVLRARFDLARFFRGEKAREGPVDLTHRRIFILPSRSGWGFALLLTVQFLIAINYGNNLALGLTFLLASIAVLSALHSFRNLAGLRVTSGRAEPVFAGDMAWFEVNVDNPSRLPRWGLSARLGSADGSCEFDVPAEQRFRMTLAARTTRRGWRPIDTLTVSTSYPLGLFRAWSPINLTQRVLVYPRPSSELHPLPPVASGHGDASSHAWGDDDFGGFHAYRPGDSLKRIHWKGLAKGQTLQVKHYVALAGQNTDLDWQNAPGSDTEQRLSVLCRWVLEAERAGSAYRLRLPTQTIVTGSGEAHRRRCLEALALFDV